MSHFKDQEKTSLGITEPLELSKCIFVQSPPKVGRVLDHILSKMLPGDMYPGDVAF